MNRCHHLWFLHGFMTVFPSAETAEMTGRLVVPGAMLALPEALELKDLCLEVPSRPALIQMYSDNDIIVDSSYYICR